MQDAALQSAIQPFVKLTQSNVELMTKFALSREVNAQAMHDVQKLYQQVQDSAAKLMRSNAFAGLMQGFMKNFTEFCTEFGQSGASMLSQGQAAWVQQAQAAATNVVSAAPQWAARRAA